MNIHEILRDPIWQSIGVIIAIIGIIIPIVYGRKKSYYRKNEHRNEELLDIVIQIKKYANIILIENEKTLSPLFHDKPNRKKIKNSLHELFIEQKGRANFGEWEGYLTNAHKIIKYRPVKRLIAELITLLGQLHNSLYSYSDSSRAGESNFNTMKHYMMASIENESVSITNLRLSADSYLEFIRGKIEKIGVIAGKLKALA